MKTKYFLIFCLTTFVFCPWLFAQGSFVKTVPSQNDGHYGKAAAPGSGELSDDSPASGDDPVLNRRWLLAVGVKKFADTRVPPLKYTSEDARSFAQYFLDDGVPESRIALLIDEDATRENIMAALGQIKGEIGAEDSFFFFYSSHGAGDAEGRTYFIAFDTVSDELSATGIPMQQLRDIVKSFPCKNVVVLVDTCHSGGTKALAKQNEKEYEQLVRAANQNTRVAILTSSRTHETSVESEQWGHGAFTHFLLDGIAGAADNFPENGRVSVTELFDHVMVAVPRATKRAQHPSGKFSYNWPAQKDAAVSVGRVKRSPGGAQDYGNAGTNPGSSPPPPPPAGGRKWQSVFE